MNIFLCLRHGYPNNSLANYSMCLNNPSLIELSSELVFSHISLVIHLPWKGLEREEGACKWFFWGMQPGKQSPRNNQTLKLVKTKCFIFHYVISPMETEGKKWTQFYNLLPQEHTVSREIWLKTDTESSESVSLCDTDTICWNVEKKSKMWFFLSQGKDLMGIFGWGNYRWSMELTHMDP